MIVSLTVAMGLSIAAPMAPLTPFVGHWKGTCRLDPAYEGTSSFPAELIVTMDASDPNKLGWTIVYDMGVRETRPYEIVAVSPADAHYAIDEKNGLMLDAYVRNNTLRATFAIGEAFIASSYQILPDGSLQMSLPQFEARGVRQTCLTGNESTCTNAFGLMRDQLCLLTREP